MELSDEDGTDSIQYQEEQRVLNALHQQRWDTKLRRRSSDMKRFVSDRLELSGNPKISILMAKHG